MGNYIQNRGIGQTVIEARLHGRATFDQILRGKHMNLEMEATFKIS